MAILGGSILQNPRFCMKPGDLTSQYQKCVGSALQNQNQNQPLRTNRPVHPPAWIHPPFPVCKRNSEAPPLQAAAVGRRPGGPGGKGHSIRPAAVVTAPRGAWQGEQLRGPGQKHRIIKHSQHTKNTPAEREQHRPPCMLGKPTQPPVPRSKSDLCHLRQDKDRCPTSKSHK